MRRHLLVVATILLAGCLPYPGGYAPEIHTGAATSGRAHPGGLGAAPPRVEADLPAPPAVVRPNPYLAYRFRVRMDGVDVAAVSQVSGLSRTTQVTTFRAGGDPAAPRLMPGQTAYEPVVLARGVTTDAAFEAWCSRAWDWGNVQAQPGANVSLAEFRKDLTIELYNEAGQKVVAYRIYRAWPSSFTTLPEAEEGAGGVPIQALTLQHEGWARDASVVAPAEPSFTLPAS